MPGWCRRWTRTISLSVLPCAGSSSPRIKIPPHSRRQPSARGDRLLSPADSHDRRDHRQPDTHLGSAGATRDGESRRVHLSGAGTGKVGLQRMGTTFDPGHRSAGDAHATLLLDPRYEDPMTPGVAGRPVIPRPLLHLLSPRRWHRRPAPSFDRRAVPIPPRVVPTGDLP